jgi:hypothetical protein
LLGARLANSLDFTMAETDVGFVRYVSFIELEKKIRQILASVQLGSSHSESE